MKNSINSFALLGLIVCLPVHAQKEAPRLIDLKALESKINYKDLSDQKKLRILELIKLEEQQRSLGGNTSGGGDRIEPLFHHAQNRMSLYLERITHENMHQLHIPNTYKNWLMKGDNLSKLQFYVSSMILLFQEAPCGDGETLRGACFEDTIPEQPIMIVSYRGNQGTTLLEAAALVIHEAGHLLGEMDHMFLSRLGHELVTNPMIIPTGNLESESTFKNPDGSITFFVPKLKVPSSVSSTGRLYINADTSSVTGTCINFGFSNVVNWLREEKFTRWAATLRSDGGLGKFPHEIKKPRIKVCSDVTGCDSGRGIIKSITCSP